MEVLRGGRRGNTDDDLSRERYQAMLQDKVSLFADGETWNFEWIGGPLTIGEHGLHEYLVVGPAVIWRLPRDALYVNSE